MDRRRSRLVLPVMLAVWGLALFLAAGCGNDRSGDVFGPAQFQLEGIPMPLIDSAVEGWFQYEGNGRFVTDEGGREFFWRDGRFVNPDGTMIYGQPTRPPTLSSERSALVDEAERIRRGLIDGTLVFEWQSAPGSDLPADPQEALDAIEKFAFDPDVVVYLKDSGTSDALIQDIDAMPEVQFHQFVGEEKPATIKLWLNDRAQSAQVVGKLQGREEVKEVRSLSVDFEGLAALLQNATHARQ